MLACSVWLWLEGKKKPTNWGMEILSEVIWMGKNSFFSPFGVVASYHNPTGLKSCTCACFGSTYAIIGMIQRRLAWSLEPGWHANLWSILYFKKSHVHCTVILDGVKSKEGSIVLQPMCLNLLAPGSLLPSPTSVITGLIFLTVHPSHTHSFSPVSCTLVLGLRVE